MIDRTARQWVVGRWINGAVIDPQSVEPNVVSRVPEIDRCGLAVRRTRADRVRHVCQHTTVCPLPPPLLNGASLSASSLAVSVRNPAAFGWSQPSISAWTRRRPVRPFWEQPPLHQSIAHPSNPMPSPAVSYMARRRSARTVQSAPNVDGTCSIQRCLCLVLLHLILSGRN